MAQKGRSNRIKAILKLLVLLFIIAGIPAILYLHYGSGIFSSESIYTLEKYILEHRHYAALIIIGLQIIQVVICFLPGQPIQFAASYFFGVVPGFLLSIAGAVIGTTISFWLARFLGRDFLYLLFDRRSIEDYRSKINSGRGLLIVFLLYLVPGLPKDLVSYAAGISDMRFITFLTMSSVGRSPGMIGSLLFGHFFSRKNGKAIIILAIITAILVIMFIVFRKKILRMLDEFEARSATHKENSSNVQEGQN